MQAPAVTGGAACGGWNGVALGVEGGMIGGLAALL